MNEKELLLGFLKQEFATTLKVMRAYPEGKEEYTPHERSNSALKLASLFVVEMQLIKGGIKGEVGSVDGSGIKSITQAAAEFEALISELTETFENSQEENLNLSLDFFGMKLRRMEFIWMMLHDQIHHRGQFSTYLRPVGGKVPSIYGPSGDEPWKPV